MPEAPSPGHWCEVWPLLEALVGSPNIAVITTKHNHAPCLDSNFQYTTISPWAQTLQRRAFRPGFYRRTRTSRRSRTRPLAPASSSWWRQSPPCSTRASPIWKKMLIFIVIASVLVSFNDQWHLWLLACISWLWNPLGRGLYHTSS